MSQTANVDRADRLQVRTCKPGLDIVAFEITRYVTSPEILVLSL
jgi:hypothetical protein